MSLPSAWVDYHPTAAVRTIQGDIGLHLVGVASLKEGGSAQQILELFAPALLAAGTEQLRIRGIGALRKGGLVLERWIKTEQLIRGIPVRYAGVSLSLDRAAGLVKRLNADFLPDRGLPAEPQLTADQAKAILAKELGSESDPELARKISEGRADLAYVHGTSGRADDSGRFERLVWAIQYGNVSGLVETWADAMDGKVLRTHPLSMS